MSLELGGALLAFFSLLVTVPLALSVRARGAAHASLAGLAVLTGYCALALVLGVDTFVRQPLSPTLRFTRGFAAGIGVGLVLAGWAVAVYDILTASRSGKRLS